MQLGILLGLMAGVAGIAMFNIPALIDRICLVGMTLLVFQLAGATLASVLGRPAL